MEAESAVWSCCKSSHFSVRNVHNCMLLPSRPKRGFVLTAIHKFFSEISPPSKNSETPRVTWVQTSHFSLCTNNTFNFLNVWMKTKKLVCETVVLCTLWNSAMCPKWLPFERSTLDWHVQSLFLNSSWCLVCEFHKHLYAKRELSCHHSVPKSIVFLHKPSFSI